MPKSTGAGVSARFTPMRLASGERPSNPSVLRWSTPRGRRRRVSASPRTSSRNAPNAMPRSWRSLSESGGSCSSGKYAPLPERGCSASCGFATAKLTTASERESGTRSSRIETPACLMRTISRAAATCCAADSDAHLGSSRSPSKIAGSTKLPAGSGTSPTLIFAPTSRKTGVIVSIGKQAVSCDVRSTRALARGADSCGASGPSRTIVCR